MSFNCSNSWGFSLVVGLLIASGLAGYVAAQPANGDDDRIINGQEVSITQVPWQVAVLSSSDKRFLCAELWSLDPERDLGSLGGPLLRF